MRHLRAFVLLVLLGLVAVACGTTVSDEEAATELAAEAGGSGGGGSGGSGGAALGSGTDALDSGSTSSGDDADLAAGSGDTGGTTAGGDTGGTTSGGDTATGGTDTGTAGPVKSAGGATDVGVTASEIRLGWVGTLTGPVPGIFRGALVGTQAWINYQNSQGGLMGRQLRLVPADDALDSGKNRAAHLQLKDKVFSFVGSFSITDDGGAPVVTECKCPDVSGNLSVAMHNSPSHYGPQPAAPGWRSGPPRYYAKKFPKEVIEKMAFFYSQVPVSQAIAVQQRRVYEQAGFKVVYERGVPPNDNNQTADVVQMQRAGVRTIAFQGDLDTFSRLITAMAQQNFTVDLFNLGNSIYDANTFKVVKPDQIKNLFVDQVYAMFLGEDGARIPEVKLFNEWMKKTDPNQPVNLFAMYGWLSGRLFADAMNKMAKEGKNPVRADLLNTLKGWGTWDGYGMVAPVKVGTKTPSDCFFVFTSTPDGKFQRTYPEGGEPYACGDGPFSAKP
jgi:ABC-type branched-subunit amino acid transport system substrate-binding protein